MLQFFFSIPSPSEDSSPSPCLKHEKFGPTPARLKSRRILTPHSVNHETSQHAQSKNLREMQICPFCSTIPFPDVGTMFNVLGCAVVGSSLEGSLLRSKSSCKLPVDYRFIGAGVRVSLFRQEREAAEAARDFRPWRAGRLMRHQTLNPKI